MREPKASESVGPIPRTATFRRAEGLTFELHPCDGMARADVTSHHFGGPSHTVLSREDARLLFELSRWRSADELGVPHEKLVALVRSNLLFWSSGRPDRDLTGFPLPELSGTVALRRNCWPSLHMLCEGDLWPLPLMPRLGELDGAELGGYEFAVLELGQDVYTVSFSCCPRHAGLLRDLLPRLDGRHDVGVFAAEERALVEALGDLGLLEPHAAPKPPAGPSVTWLGHASVLYEAGGSRILVDPALFGCSIPSRHELAPPDWRDLGRVDAVLVTHGDVDHFNMRFLTLLPRDTPIYVPRPRIERPYQVDMQAQLALLGFEHVVSLAEWEVASLGDVRVVAAPFRGEDWGLDLVACTYLIDGPGLTIYLSADAEFMPDVCRRIAGQYDVDLALLGVSNNAEARVMPPEYGWGYLYDAWIPPERRQEWIQLCAGPKESAEAARLLGARQAFGYAAGGASFIGRGYEVRGSHSELAEQLASAGLGDVAVELPLGAPFRIPTRKPVSPSSE